MMRVLQVIGVMDRGGAETMIMNLYRAMDRSDLQFDFLVHEQREGDYDAEIRRLGGRLYRLPRFTGINERTYRKQCRLLFAQHPEWAVVHGHIGSSAPIYLSEAKRVGCFAIAHSHAQNYQTGLAGLAFNMVSHPVRRVADYYMACSREAGLDRFGRNLVDGDRFSIVPNGIDLSRYVCGDDEHKSAKRDKGLVDMPVFGHVGRLAPEKNHAFLLQVFAKIHHALPNAVLLLAGRGPLEDELRAKAAQLGLGEAVRFLGVCDDVPEVLRAMDVFLMPSTSEGLAMAAVEAQASGLPCVLSTGVPELALVCSNAHRLSLEEGASTWAQHALAAYERTCSQPRIDAVEEVREHGFDIAETSSWLAHFYRRAALGLTCA